MKHEYFVDCGEGVTQGTQTYCQVKAKMIETIILQRNSRQEKAGIYSESFRGI